MRSYTGTGGTKGNNLLHYTIGWCVLNNHFIFDKRIGLSSISVVPLTRYFRHLANNPESLVLERINSGKPTTSSVINKILLNQNLLTQN